MDEAPEIRNLGQGKYSFLIGRQRYTLTTPLEDENFVRIVSTIQNLVSSFPPTLAQDERMFLALMSMSHQLDNMQSRISLLLDSVNCSQTDS